MNLADLTDVLPSKFIYGLETLPDYMRDGIALYVARGLLPGGFLLATLACDTDQAHARADATNRYLVGAYIRFLVEHAPKDCWGSYAKIDAWIERGGLRGKET